MKLIPYDIPNYWNITEKWWELSAGEHNKLYIQQVFSGKQIALILQQHLNWETPKEMENEQIILCIDWMFHNIFREIESLNYNSLGVLLRIFTGMLMKCDVNITFLQDLHRATINALWKLYWRNMTKDLPF